MFFSNLLSGCQDKFRKLKTYKKRYDCINYMNELEHFIAQFWDVKINTAFIKKKAKEFYLISEKTKDFIDKFPEEPVSAGVLLGSAKKTGFQPTPALLNLINEQTNQKIILNDKSSWLFICGRDIFLEGIEENLNPDAKTVIVLNDKKEVIGVAIKKFKQYNNMYDIGIFLRTKR